MVLKKKHFTLAAHKLGYFGGLKETRLIMNIPYIKYLSSSYVLFDMQRIRNDNLQFIYSSTKRVPAKLAVVCSQASPDILRCTICGDREYYHSAVARSDLQSRFQLQRNSLLKSHRRTVDRIWEPGPNTGEYCKWILPDSDISFGLIIWKKTSKRYGASLLCQPFLISWNNANNAIFCATYFFHILGLGSSCT